MSIESDRHAWRWYKGFYAILLTINHTHKGSLLMINWNFS